MKIHKISDYQWDVDFENPVQFVENPVYNESFRVSFLHKLEWLKREEQLHQMNMVSNSFSMNTCD